MDKASRLRAVIPAAGKGTRSGLSYPKTLYKLDGIPILVRICRLMAPYDPQPIIIINPAFDALFTECLDEAGISATLVHQPEARGMGDALLVTDPLLRPNDEIMLTWSDIPLISPLTVEQLVACHSAHRNNFSMVTRLGADCYTIVERDDQGRLLRVLETRALGIQPASYGERDIGLFVFRKEPMFSILKQGLGLQGDAEHGFLYAIEMLAAAGERLEAYPIAQTTDVLSFNTPEELAAIEAAMGG
jgi:bifunctional UDP-N-acetylglucosamine pyrophosphorylase/glucosamine-1-phosphate N-acetyltransferase